MENISTFPTFCKYTCFYLLFVCFFVPTTVYAQDIKDLLSKLNQAPNNTDKLALYSQIGIEYQKQNAHKKATEYLEKAYQISKEETNTKQTPLLLRGLAYSYAELKEYKNATQTHQKLLDLYAKVQDEVGQLRTMQSLANIAKLNNEDNEAISYYNNVLAIQQKRKDIEGQTSTYNNLGYLYKRIGDREKSIQNFNEALNVNKNQQNAAGQDKATMLTNTGVCYANLGDFRQAKNYFAEALAIREKQGNAGEIASTHNYLAANYYVSGNNAQALTTAQRALEYANTAQNEEVLMTTYRILAEIYQKDNDFRESQRYDRLYQEQKNRLADKEAKQRQQMLQNQVEIEQKENELKSLIAERDRSEAALKQSTLEKQKQAADIARKQEELARLKSEQALQAQELKNSALQQRQTEQALQLAKQEVLQAESNEKLKEKEIQELKYQDEQIKQKAKIREEREKRGNEMRVLEATNKTQAEKNKAQAEKARSDSYMFWFAVLIFVLILVFVLGSLYLSQRARKKLGTKNKEIEKQRQEILSSHEELQQNQEEIVAQREFIEEQNSDLTVANQRMKDNENILRKSIEKLRAKEEEIKLQNAHLQERDKQISSSISAAKTIQTAILPYTAKLDQLLRDYFIIYRPKDVVSGDFYWLNEVEGKTIFVVADCTGHGVPGAFMTLIGNSLLDKVIRVWNIHEPADILERLHEEVRIVLRQDDSANNNGMDLIVVQMKNTETGRDIIFSGAKNSLYYTQNGNVTTLKGDRKSVGGEQNEKKKFTNQHLSLPTGSMVYLSSDGFIDQNDIDRKRFGEKRLIDIFGQVAKLGMDEQQQYIENVLNTYMHDTYQRDDILLIGVKI